MQVKQQEIIQKTMQEKQEATLRECIQAATRNWLESTQ